ncbi:hypothetical protein L3X38_026722 [Prunus dulcis]|uniref:Uncharacterized protein n=1 Tax=Prunus dulcis TaxID=3755 RepID=A0AAD4VMH7_PRUDU|nr:hypothetical protein L3X38_026722 [Prunus dulcis]
MDAEAIFSCWSSGEDPWYKPMLELASETGESEHSLEFFELEKLLSLFREFFSSAREVFFFALREARLITSSRYRLGLAPSDDPRRVST